MFSGLFSFVGPSIRRLVSRKLLAAAMLATPLVHAATFYVSPSGSDSNPGSATQPFRNVSKGVAVARAGDTVILEDGTYGHEGQISDRSGGMYGYAAPVRISHGGNSSAWITVKARNSGRAILDCGTTTTVMGCDKYITLFSSAGYWSFEGLVFTRGAFGGIGTDNGASNIRVLGCRFENIGIWSDPTQIGESGIGFDRGSYNWWIEGNVFHDIGRTGTSILDHGIYASGTNVTIINNIFYNMTDGWALQLADGANNWLIANNTFAFPHTSQSGHIMLWNANSNLTIRDNIFYNPGSSYAIARYASNVSNCSIDHNIVTGSSSIISSTSGCSVSSNQMGSDPRFANSSAFDFHIQSGSAAIDNGIAVSGVGIDLDGTARPQGSSPDVGAYEYRTSSSGPVITGVFASSILSNSAAINWTTDKVATGQVEYGPSGYTSASSLQTSLLTIHSIVLFNLSPGTLYHYRVSSRDSAGTLTVSPDFTFTTLPLTVSSAFSISAAPSALSLQPGQSAASTVTAGLVSGSPGPVTFSTTGLPAGVSASFSTGSCTPTCNATMTVSASSSAAAGSYSFTVRGNSSSSSASTTMSLTIGGGSTPGNTGSGLAALWDFSEQRGSKTADSSGNGNTGQLKQVTWQSSVCYACVWLNGYSSHIYVPESASLQMTSSLTVSMWLRPGASGGIDPRVVSKRYSWDVKLNGSNRYPQFSGAGKYAMMNRSLTPGVWQHVVFTFSNGTVNGYVDGQPVSFAANTFAGNETLPVQPYGLYLGTDSDRTTFYYGTMDDVRLYNRALTAADVATLYSTTRH